MKDWVTIGLLSCIFWQPALQAQSTSPQSRRPIPLASLLAGRGVNQITVTEGQRGVYELTTTGTDPFFRIDLPALTPVSEATPRPWILQLEYFCPAGIKHLQWRSGKTLHSPQAPSLPGMMPAEGWTEYKINLTDLDPNSCRSRRPFPARIDLGQQANVKLRIRNVHVRPMSDQEYQRAQEAAARIAAKKELAQEIQDYLHKQWPGSIEQFQIQEQTLSLEGLIEGDKQGDYFLVPRHSHEISASPANQESLDQAIPVPVKTEGTWSLTLNAADHPTVILAGNRLQLYRKLESKWEPISSAVYASRQHSDNPLPPPPKLHAAKGLTCITPRYQSQQLRDLGLKHASVNVGIHSLLSDTPRPKWPAITVLGKRWWMNPLELHHLDRSVRIIRDAGATVAMIVLIRGPGNPASLLAHPESDSAGAYAMPNLTTKQAAERYRASIEVLAKRYGGGPESVARADHWIIHNEVDYGWQWTNMGEQPMELFMDHYVRSMRIVQQSVQQYNPHAYTFISLTHRWNIRENVRWKTYAPKAMVEHLIELNQREGDFAWGLAYHPYPQSLWKANTWDDTQVDDDFETKLITIKNLQVLDRWMHQDKMRRSDGSLRPVICSEQGFHADPDDPQALTIQSAALLYTWQKLRQCPSIVAFDYHRPNDHPDEGGLLLGLRTYSTADEPIGKPKPAWDTYQAIGTEREAELIKQTQHLWADE